MAIKISGRKKPFPYFEIRWMKKNHRGSFLILGIFGIKQGFEVNICGFYGVFGKSYNLESAPLTPEERKMAEELSKFETDD